MKENSSSLSNFRPGPTLRITRSRAASLTSSSMLPPKPPAKENQFKAPRGSSKRPASAVDNKYTAPTASSQQKKRAVLTDVSNFCCTNSYKNCIAAPKVQPKSSRGVKTYTGKKVKPVATVDVIEIFEDPKADVAEVNLGTMSSRLENNPLLGKLDKNELQFASLGLAEPLVDRHSLTKDLYLMVASAKVKEKFCDGTKSSKGPDFIDIDADQKDPLLCSLYASEIYQYLRVQEAIELMNNLTYLSLLQLLRRPSFDFMEKIQLDITQSMRAILIDWLVEVSEEYRLVADTLYLTIYVLDRFLSSNYIERPKLQLLGITCMLIASKYEEICAPRAEEFCFITDNTYTRDEVLKMESRVLNYMGFHLSTPTAKTFLRRYLRAAQSSYKVPSTLLELLANYLAELTLVEYDFIKFLPSAIAASAVFLARWTINQSEHPWNTMLEHYTCYSSSDLKPMLMEMQELQLNSRGCPLNAIRDKYRQEKFQCVSTLNPPKLLQTLF